MEEERVVHAYDKTSLNIWFVEGIYAYNFPHMYKQLS